MRKNLDALERGLVLKAVAATRGKKKEACELLGIDPRNLGYYLRKHAITDEELREQFDSLPGKFGEAGARGQQDVLDHAVRGPQVDHVAADRQPVGHHSEVGVPYPHRDRPGDRIRRDSSPKGDGPRDAALRVPLYRRRARRRPAGIDAACPAVGRQEQPERVAAQ